MRSIDATLIVVLMMMMPSLLAQDESMPSFNALTINIGEAFEFESKILSEKRRLNIYLPPNYKTNPRKRYPVIYLLDGSMDEDFIHISGLVQFGIFYYFW